jgi:hypothetical protein
MGTSTVKLLVRWNTRTVWYLAGTASSTCRMGTVSCTARDAGEEQRQAVMGKAARLDSVRWQHLYLVRHIIMLLHQRGREQAGLRHAASERARQQRSAGSTRAQALVGKDAERARREAHHRGAW